MDEIMKIEDNSPYYLIKLPDGCDPGKWEAAEAFAESFGELKKLHPDAVFQFIPFSYDSLGGLKVLLAIAQ